MVSPCGGSHVVGECGGCHVVGTCGESVVSSSDGPAVVLVLQGRPSICHSACSQCRTREVCVI